jgi:glyoxylase-like metal-dependent hydrolase (beta-lactamase superfamily II)
VISPPSGNMEDYMNSLELLQQRDDVQFWPAHGPGIDEPESFVRSFIDHRLEREQEILEQLKKGMDTIQKMVPHIYKDIPEFLHPAAERSTLAAVIYMKKRGALSCSGEATVSSKLVIDNG